MSVLSSSYPLPDSQVATVIRITFEAPNLVNSTAYDKSPACKFGFPLSKLLLPRKPTTFAVNTSSILSSYDVNPDCHSHFETVYIYPMYKEQDLTILAEHLSPHALRTIRCTPIPRKHTIWHFGLQAPIPSTYPSRRS